MGDASDDQIVKDDLDETEHDVVEKLHTFIKDNNNLKWEPSRFSGVEQCLQKELRTLLQPLASEVRLAFATYRTTLTRVGSVDLSIPHMQT